MTAYVQTEAPTTSCLFLLPVVYHLNNQKIYKYDALEVACSDAPFGGIRAEGVSDHTVWLLYLFENNQTVWSELRTPLWGHLTIDVRFKRMVQYVVGL